MKNKDIKKFTRITIIIAIEILLTVTNLGMITWGPVSATTLHIPVIVGSILMGPYCGGIFGLVFGLVSLIKATVMPVSPVNLAFSPFLSGAPVYSIIMCIIPRVVLGIIPALLYKYIAKGKNNPFKISICGIISTFLHTVMVLTCLWVFFGAGLGFTFSSLIATIVGTNAIFEILLAAVLSGTICSPLLKYMKKGN